MLQRGFPNLKLVGASIRLLYSGLKAARIKSFERNSLAEDAGRVSWADPIIATQHLGRLIALHFQLPVTTIIATFRSDLPAPGRVELSGAADFFVEIHSDHRSDPDAIAAILAHEVAHVFLHLNRIRTEPEFHNEVLTDTTATYLGCGVLTLNGTAEKEERIGFNAIQRHQRHFGYLTLDEFGYVLAKRDLAFGHDSFQQLKNGLPKEGFMSGRNRLKWEHAQRPFVPRWLLDRATHRLLNAFRRQLAQPRSIIFECPCCSQSLRITANWQKVHVRCAVCDSVFTCYS